MPVRDSWTVRELFAHRLESGGGEFDCLNRVGSKYGMKYELTKDLAKGEVYEFLGDLDIIYEARKKFEETHGVVAGICDYKYDRRQRTHVVTVKQGGPIAGLWYKFAHFVRNALCR